MKKTMESPYQNDVTIQNHQRAIRAAHESSDPGEKAKFLQFAADCRYAFMSDRRRERRQIAKLAKSTTPNYRRPSADAIVAATMKHEAELYALAGQWCELRHAGGTVAGLLASFGTSRDGFAVGRFIFDARDVRAIAGNAVELVS